MNWISVEDRLPSDSRDVLVYTTLYLIGSGWYSKADGWHGHIPDSECGIVTHWMPLPEPPDVASNN